MYYDIVKAEYLSDYKIKVSFADGSSGIADLKAIISRGGIFSELKNLDNFKNFSIH
uniref:DUF2442 domain-containing protein n=1 Tax=Ignavibacterium album TaxID=591197 RepID=A0A832CYA0_9BACT